MKVVLHASVNDRRYEPNVAGQPHCHYLPIEGELVEQELRHVVVLLCVRRHTSTVPG